MSDILLWEQEQQVRVVVLVEDVGRDVELRMKENQETQSFRLFLKVGDAYLLIRGPPDPSLIGG